jgi:bifunctional non-homologous end joining protein LigD
MPKIAFEPCIPPRGIKVPTGPDWIHEIKHDGYRLVVQRDGARVRLFTRNGNDWTGRYPLIVEAALKNRQTSFVIDGEAVLLGVDRLLARRPEGIFVSDFEQGEIGPDLFRAGGIDPIAPAGHLIGSR